MSKIYYEETLKSGEKVVVTDSYVKYVKYGRVDQMIPLKSIDNVTIGTYNNTRMEYWRNAAGITITLGMIMMLIMKLIYTTGSYNTGFALCYLLYFCALAGMFFAPLYMAKYAFFIRTSSGYDISIHKSSFKDKKNDPQILMDAITKAMEENK